MVYEFGLFNNLMRSYPTEKEHLFHAIEYMISHGTGGDILDEISRKSFKDSNDEYLNRIKKEAISREDGLFIIYRALIKWYETWKDSFSNFSNKNALVKYREQPTHTWLHCFLTGQQALFQNLIGEEYVVVEKNKWEESKKEAKNSIQYLTHEKKEFDYNQEKINRLLKLYRVDEEIKYKELLLDKRIAVFLEDQWTDNQINEIKIKYHLKTIKQFSAIEPTHDVGNFDFYLFLTSKASHSAKYKLESRVPKDNLFLISSTNYFLVIEQFIEQLKGRIAQ
ncbi:hypothetical protein [Rossellomorea aquimaris]|uniref:hypothetical protein n=1 Tax=Rossellomorea aquimaris TaxID=189382 RepID=UPI0011E8A7CC|nr:hypothetical protein [Rossellomorea aquimaris]TYS86226.1 hypothetical protein FZC88_19045 [Rossellomorea aquimaris]